MENLPVGTRISLAERLAAARAAAAGGGAPVEAVPPAPALAPPPPTIVPPPSIAPAAPPSEDSIPESSRVPRLPAVPPALSTLPEMPTAPPPVPDTYAAPGSPDAMPGAVPDPTAARPALPPTPVPVAPPAPSPVAPPVPDESAAADADASAADASFKFSAPREQRVDALVRALRARPEDASLPCWPAALLRSAPASIGLARGERPALIVFYDDTAKASRLAAADLWPVVLEVESKVDIVLVDLTPGSKHTLSDDEKRLVRRYYTGYVPTTVVLTSDRVPRLLKSERVEAALVRAACLEAR